MEVAPDRPYDELACRFDVTGLEVGLDDGHPLFHRLTCHDQFRQVVLAVLILLADDLHPLRHPLHDQLVSGDALLQGFF